MRDPDVLTFKVQFVNGCPQLCCDICEEPGGIGESYGDLELGRIDLSINDDEIAHRKCWTRDPEAKQWAPFR